MLTNKKDLLPDLFDSTPCRVLRRIRINLICTRLVSLVIFYQCFKEKSIDKMKIYKEKRGNKYDILYRTGSWNIFSRLGSNG